jgi:low affinity Fe/Cu permease
MNEFFRRFSHRASEWVGSPSAFIVAVFIVLAWLGSGPMFGYSDTWQLVINTGTTIVTFLMVFLIQNTQNRDAKAIHLKLDELIRTTERARNSLVDLESLSDEELAQLQEQFARLRQREASQVEPSGIGQLEDSLDEPRHALAQSDPHRLLYGENA